MPKRLRSKVLDFIHKSHNGMVLMKKLARSIVYWLLLNYYTHRLTTRRATAKQRSELPIEKSISKPNYVVFKNGDRAYYLNQKQIEGKWIPCTIIKKDSTFIYKNMMGEPYRLAHVL